MQGELHRWYENCEMRTIVLSDDAGSGALDPLWFPGGHQLRNIKGNYIWYFCVLLQLRQLQPMDTCNHGARHHQQANAIFPLPEV